jgi:superfamily II DNA or RNA helicase
MITLRYEDGRVRVEGGEIYLGAMEPSDEYPGYMYPQLVRHLEASGTEYRDEAMKAPSPPTMRADIDLRDYQSEALSRWSQNESRGIVVLPTGAGKTFIAVKAIEALQASTLIAVPTIVLVEQWREVLEEYLGVDVGALGGGERDIQPVTVSTYDSASLQAGRLGNRFRLLVFDEVHHLAAPTYRRIATWYLAPYRLGLTATLQGDEATQELYGELVGPTVYRLGVDSLAGSHLSDYTVKTVKLPLTPEERAEYDRQYEIYRGFLRRRNIRIRGARDYLRLVRRSGRDPEARRAVQARGRAMDIALNGGNKVAYLKSLLKANPGEKTLIFTSHNKLVYRLSRMLLIPAITHQTPQAEREDILGGFRDGSYRRLVTSRVLDEGVDVPDASMAVIISGSGSNRQFIQRLGRILRKTPGKEAVLFELVSEGTAETYISARRRRR